MDYDEMICRIKHEMKHQNISKNYVMKKSELPYSTLSDALCDRSKRRHMAQVDTLCRILDVMNQQIEIIPKETEPGVSGDGTTRELMKKINGLTEKKKEFLKEMVEYLYG